MRGRLRSTPLLIRQPPRNACCSLPEPVDALARQALVAAASGLRAALCRHLAFHDVA
jgi:hypothetical protein